jgi:hypothetical protein
MNKQLKKNRNIILMLFAISIIPFLIAWYLAEHPEWFKASTNRGELIVPVVTTEKNDFTGWDDFSRQNLKELTGHWVLLNIVAKAPCDEACLQPLYQTKQLRLMMNKDLTRIRRAVLFLTDIDSKSLEQWWQQDQRILRLQATPALANKIRDLIGQPPVNGWLILMDPMGNLMMKYKPGFDPYDVKKDLGKLLRISQIG